MSYLIGVLLAVGLVAVLFVAIPPLVCAAWKYNLNPIGWYTRYVDWLLDWSER